MTIEKLARILKVSSRTISGVINNKSYVNGKTRERILVAIDKYNFIPNSVAQQLIYRKSRVIVFICYDISHPFIKEVIRGINTVAEENNYVTIFINSDRNLEKERAAINFCRSYKVAGIIIQPVDSISNESLFNCLKQENIPFVMISKIRLNTNYVIAGDDKIIAYEAVNYLLSIGYKKIAYIGPTYPHTVNCERLNGYKEALEEHKLSLNDEWIISENSNSLLAGYNACTRLLDKAEKPEAIFAFSDLVAVGCIKAIKDKGLKIPDDLAVIGVDDIEYAEYCEVPLTTMALPKFELGVKATETLFDIINGRGKGYFKIILQPELIIRKSCGNSKG